MKIKNFRFDEQTLGDLRYVAAVFGTSQTDAVRQLIPRPWLADLMKELALHYDDPLKSPVEHLHEFFAVAAESHMVDVLRIHPAQAHQQTAEATLHLFVAAMRAARGEAGYKLVPANGDTQYFFVHVIGDAS